MDAVGEAKTCLVTKELYDCFLLPIKVAKRVVSLLEDEEEIQNGIALYIFYIYSY